MIFDETGDRLRPTYASKQGKRNRYYVSGRLKTGGDRNGGWRVPAVELEPLVEQQAHEMLNDGPLLWRWIAEAASMENVGIRLSAAAKMADDISDPAAYETRQHVFGIMLDRIILSPISIKFFLNHRALALHLAGGAPPADAPTGDACIAVERAFNQAAWR